jgi:hypothetical protein
MLYSEIIAVCSEIYTKHINTLCGQNVEFVNVKHGGTYSNHRALKLLCPVLALSLRGLKEIHKYFREDIMSFDRDSKPRTSDVSPQRSK